MTLSECSPVSSLLERTTNILKSSTFSIKTNNGYHSSKQPVLHITTMQMKPMYLTFLFGSTFFLGDHDLCFGDGERLGNRLLGGGDLRLGDLDLRGDRDLLRGEYLPRLWTKCNEQKLLDALHCQTKLKPMCLCIVSNREGWMVNFHCALFHNFADVRRKQDVKLTKKNKQNPISTCLYPDFCICLNLWMPV